VSCDAVLIFTVFGALTVVNIISFSALLTLLLYSFVTPDVEDWNGALQFVIRVQMLLCNAVCCVKREVVLKQKDGVVLTVMKIGPYC
jgi:hypothetical protein